MGKYVNPFTDHGWKIIFGQEMNKDLIIDKEIMPEVNLEGTGITIIIRCTVFTS